MLLFVWFQDLKKKKKNDKNELQPTKHFPFLLSCETQHKFFFTDLGATKASAEAAKARAMAADFIFKV